MASNTLNSEDILGKEPYVDVKPLYDILRNCSESYKKYNILLAAIDIGLFNYLYLNAPQSVSVLSRELGTDFKLTQKMCEYLQELGFLVKENGAYKNAEISNLYLQTGSPLMQHNVFKNLQNGLKLWGKLAETLKSHPIMITEEKFFSDNLIHSLAEEALCSELHRTVNIIAEFPEFKKAKRLLDLGGGHGLYAIAFSKLKSDLQGYVYDFPEVIEDTKIYIEKHNADRVKVISGNFFTSEITEKYDVIFFASNPGGKNPNLVPKIYASLKEGGLFINKHCFYCKDEGSKNILLDIEWNLTTFAGVRKGDKVYSFEGDCSFEEYMQLME